MLCKCLHGFLPADTSGILCGRYPVISMISTRVSTVRIFCSKRSERPFEAPGEQENLGRDFGQGGDLRDKSPLKMFEHKIRDTWKITGIPATTTTLNPLSVRGNYIHTPPQEKRTSLSRTVALASRGHGLQSDNVFSVTAASLRQVKLVAHEALAPSRA